MPKRLDAVAPPAVAEQWRITFGTSEAARGWPELCQQYANVVAEAWERMRHQPLDRSDTQKPLGGALGMRQVGGRQLPQWQIDIASGARLLYCVDSTAHTVWVMYASTAHPGATTSKGKRSSRNR